MNNPYVDLLAELSGPSEDWREQSVCSDSSDPDLWFTEGKDDRGNRQRIRDAQAICRTCPVAVQCLDWAISTRQQYGVWGGKNFNAGYRSHMADRTHCKHGHEFTPENTVLDINGEGRQYRRCVECTRAKNARAEANRKPRASMASNFQGSLSERRQRVAQMTKAGMSSSEIARRLDIDARTVLRDRQVMA